MLVHTPPGSVERSAACRPACAPLASTVIGNSPKDPAGRPFHGLGAELGRDGQPARIGVGVDDAPGAQGARGVDRVEGDAHPAAADDEDVGARPLREMGSDRAPAVGDVVARAGRPRGRCPPGAATSIASAKGTRTRSESAPPQSPPNIAEAVHRARRHARAVAGLPGAAAHARATGDLEGHHDAVARRDARTSSPTSVTSATNSWPMAIGPGMGASPRRIGWSRSHRATASGRTSASPGPWSAGAGTSHHSTCRSAVIVSCCISPPVVAGVGAAGARPRAARRHSAVRGPARGRPRAWRW